MSTSYHNLDSLAVRLGLPRTYLRGLARRREIPYLKVGRRLRFDEEAVRSALRKLSEVPHDET